MLTSSGIEEVSLGTASDEASLTNGEDNDEEWRMVTAIFETQSVNASRHADGVLILEGEEPGSRDARHDESCCSLSVPGTDSVPSILQSIEGLPDGETKPKIDSDNPSETTSRSTRTEPAGLSSAPAGEAPKANSSHSETWRSSHFLVPTMALFILVAVKSVQVCYERKSLLADVSKLEEERDFLLVSVSKLQLEVQALKTEAEDNRKQEGLRWDDCISKDTMIFDNCWLTANAHVQIGDCANEKIDSIREFSHHLLEQLGNRSSWIDPFSHASSFEDVSETVSKIMRKVDSLGKTLWETTTTEHYKEVDLDGGKQRPSFSSLKTTRNRLRDWKDSFSSFYSWVSSEGNQKNPPSTRSGNRSGDSVEDVVWGVADILNAAGSLSVTAGEAIVAVAIEKATEALDNNESSINELVKIARQALEDASLSGAIGS